MTPVKMRIAKQELHKAIVDIILSFDDITDEEMDEMWHYVKHLAQCELNAKTFEKPLDKSLKM